MIAELSKDDIESVNGGVKLDGYRNSSNVEEQNFAWYVQNMGTVMGPLMWANHLAYVARA